MTSGEVQAQHLFESGFKTILEGFRALGYDIDDFNFKDTPARCGRAFMEFINTPESIQAEIQKALNSRFPAKFDEMVVQTNIEVVSMCPHHLIPVSYKVHVAYIPNESVVGLSKLVRIPRALGRQAILQEDYTDLIVKAFQQLNPKGVGVFVKGSHGCMRYRGVKQADGHTITSAVSGAFKNNEATRNEFLQICRHA